MASSLLCCYCCCFGTLLPSAGWGSKLWSGSASRSSTRAPSSPRRSWPRWGTSSPRCSRWTSAGQWQQSQQQPAAGNLNPETFLSPLHFFSRINFWWFIVALLINNHPRRPFFSGTFQITLCLFPWLWQKCIWNKTCHASENWDQQRMVDDAEYFQEQAGTRWLTDIQTIPALLHLSAIWGARVVLLYQYLIITSLFHIILQLKAAHVTHAANSQTNHKTNKNIHLKWREHLDPRCILILVESWSMLHLNPRCILILKKENHQNLTPKIMSKSNPVHLWRFGRTRALKIQ